MKKSAAIIIMAAALTAGLTGCGEQKETARTPASSVSFEGDHYREVADEFEDCGFLNIRKEEIPDLSADQTDREGEVEEVLVGGTADYATDQIMDRNTEVLIRYHTAASADSSTAATAGSSAAPTQMPSDSSTAATAGTSVLTVENNEDFASLAETEVSAEAIRDFARRYEDRIVEFDAIVTSAENHENEHDSFDYMIRADGSGNGTVFLLEDIETYEYGLKQTLSEGDLVLVTAEIEDVDTRSGFLELDPVSLSMR